MLEKFSATVEKLYAAAADGTRWREAFTAVEQLTDCAGVVVNLIAKNQMADSVTLFGPRILEHGSTSEIDDYDRELLSICPRVAAGFAHPEAPYVCDYMILTEAEMELDPVYEWYGRHGLRYFIGSSIGETTRYRLMWSLQRTPTQGHAQDVDIHLFELLKPHMAKSLALADQLGTLRSYQRFSSAILETLPQAVFALDEQGRILLANAPGAALLAVGDGLCCAEGRLRAIQPSDQTLLDALIRDAALVPAGVNSGWARISRPNGGLPYAAFVAPLNVADGELTAASAEVLVMVHDTAEHRCANVEMLTSVYSLTETEARLASALSGGHSLESAAAVLRMGPATARTHLKAVFRKMDVNRQQDLVRVLTSLSAHASLTANHS